MSNKKVEPWRIAAFIISVAFIIFMWKRKNATHLFGALFFLAIYLHFRINML